jgi:4-hydroxy-tetrahydrodipicolinate synthase
VISGDDMITLPMVLAGGAGVISVIGEGFPAAFSKMVRLGLERKVDEAYDIHYKIAPAIDYIFAEGNPAGIKAVFSELNICGDTVRLPLVGVSADLRNEINTFIAQF